MRGMQVRDHKLMVRPPGHVGLHQRGNNFSFKFNVNHHILAQLESRSRMGIPTGKACNYTKIFHDAHSW